MLHRVSWLYKQEILQAKLEFAVSFLPPITGLTFLKENSQKDGVVVSNFAVFARVSPMTCLAFSLSYFCFLLCQTLPSGLQYKILTKGKGV